MSKRKHLGKAKRTARGFDYIEFRDHNDVPCQVQQSSAIKMEQRHIDNPGSSYLWIGTGEGLGRMHLSREHVSELIEVMQRWLYTGKLSE